MKQKRKGNYNPRVDGSGTLAEAVTMAHGLPAVIHPSAGLGPVPLTTASSASACGQGLPALCVPVSPSLENVPRCFLLHYTAAATKFIYSGIENKI